MFIQLIQDILQSVNAADLSYVFMLFVHKILFVTVTSEIVDNSTVNMIGWKVNASLNIQYALSGVGR